MPPRKKFRMKVRVKVRNRLLRRGGAAAGFVLGLSALLWLSGHALKVSRAMLGGDMLSFRPASVAVDCPEPVEATAKALLSASLGKALSARRCDELEAELKRRHDALAEAAVSRNFFTGKASLTARAEPAAAPVLLNGATFYLGETGRFMRENLSGSEEPPFRTSVTGSAAPSPELVKFLGELRAWLDGFPYKPLALDCRLPERACSVALADGSRVDWGGFEFTRLKILRLSEVLKRAEARRSGPFKVDLRSFAEGKIFVSPAK